MFTLKTLVMIISMLNLAAVLVFVVNSGSRTYAKNQELHTKHLKPFRFNEPIMAFNVLRKLDRFKRMTAEYYNTNRSLRPSFNEIYLGLKKDNSYCLKVRGYFVDHPEIYFNEKNFLTDYSPQSLIRSQIITKIGYDSMPNISYSMSKEESENPTHDIKPNVNAFFTNALLHDYQEAGRNFLCLPQLYSHIPGIGTLSRKDLMSASLTNYTQKYKGQTHCFDHEKYFPETLLLEDPKECEFFFKYIQSSDYQKLKKAKNIVFIRKIGVGSHKGEGVRVVDQEEENELKKLYENGSKCGEIKKSYLVQKYIYNPLLIEGQKFYLRVYLLISSTHPVIAYYHDGFLHISNYQSGADNLKANNTAANGLKLWSMERLSSYLVEKQQISNDKWLDEYLRPALQEALVHLVRMTQHTYLKNSGVFELLGVDFLLDENLKLWYIESNTSPSIKGKDEESEKILKKMMIDMFELVFSYMKSRLKRVIEYVNWLSLDQVVENKYLEGVIIPNIQERHKEFEDINRNRMDGLFDVSNDNSWISIIDENHEGKKRYSEFIPEDCFKQKESN